MSNVNVFENVRAAVYGRVAAYVAASHPTMPVQYQNRNTVDIEQQPNPWLGVEIVWNDGTQAALGEEPLARYTGAIWLAIYVKQNTGVRFTTQVMGELAALFKAVRDPAYFTRVPVPVPARDFKDWSIQTLRVPFTADDR